MADQEHTYKFNVSMSCGGCSGAVNRVLGKLEGESISFSDSSAPSRPLCPRRYRNPALPDITPMFTIAQSPNR